MQLVCVAVRSVLTRSSTVAVLPIVAAVALVVRLLLDIAVLTVTDVNVG
jgi:hypothetical protein